MSEETIEYSGGELSFNHLTAREIQLLLYQEVKASNYRLVAMEGSIGVLKDLAVKQGHRLEALSTMEGAILQLQKDVENLKKFRTQTRTAFVTINFIWAAVVAAWKIFFSK